MSLFARIFENEKCYSFKTKAEFDHFAERYQRIFAAGGFVYNDNGDLLMIHRLGRWDLPKGKIEPNEDARTAAVREVMEETGIDNLLIISELESTFHIYALNETPILKQTFWFEMRTKSSKPLVPQTEEDIAEARWVSRTEVEKLMETSYPSLKTLWIERERSREGERK